MGAKVIVSTPIDPGISDRLDKLCEEINRTRAEVMRGLLYALLIEDKHFIFDEWRERAKGVSHHVPDGIGKV